MKTESPMTTLRQKNAIKYRYARQVYIRICAVFLVAVLVTQTPVELAMAMNDEDLASTIEISVDRDSNRIVLMAISNGCTRSTDFDFGIDAGGAITARRIRTDPCRKKPLPVLFAYDYSQVCDALSKVGLETRVVVKGESKGQTM